MNPQKTAIFVVGATAAGKTALAIELAQHYGCPIVSADARQLYKEMTIGTAPPTAAQLAQVPHHFIYSHSILQPITAGVYEHQALHTLQCIFEKHDTAIICGGSGLYINALAFGLDDTGTPPPPHITQPINDLYQTQGLAHIQTMLQSLDPVYYTQIDTQNPARMMRAIAYCLHTHKKFSDVRTHTPKPRSFDQIWIGTNPDRPQLYDQINQRVDNMITQGLITEAQNLLPYRHLTPLQTVGYTELFDFFDKKTTQTQATEYIKQHTRNYAKRQLTWFNKNKKIHWYAPHNTQNIIDKIDELLNN